MFRTERKCQNLECEVIIEFYENPKKLFCNASCKNRFHYLSDKEKTMKSMSLKRHSKPIMI